MTECRCLGAPGFRRSAETGVEVFRWLDGPDTELRHPREVVEMVQPHSGTVTGRPALVKTRAQNEGCARRRRDQTPGVFGAGAGGIAAAEVAATVHCSGRRSGFCSETHRQRTGAAESATGRCMVERRS